METREWTYSLDEISRVASELLESVRGINILCFEGEMGAGKTTLISEMVRQWGSADSVSSPTFSIVNEYQTKDGKQLIHMDLYRLKSERELLGITFEEYIESGNICLIEWYQMAEHLLPKPYIILKLSKLGEDRRKLLIVGF